ncbi:eukaryotic translation initiation factor 4E-binding protein Mextli isoform X1 [Vespa crabro]|uniref:eukaryotic translation initiation factor 4E-binding protein Mextli isoform X1 n=1 Tax=Vespa crabro TaxID=7445 RepID=UPI001F02DA71|nr:eukaryotic translation initiation factor 4E-binding protein Mextli isoform X1 [Vespa crabro]XP_046815195.1 eukaryotic translation initiation factor 4E-binding protein Mextli isoform X1 [Vespa crabro]XP_046815196.1 eukaryotic translation initiation factor 4E-binding protein Mextli isoform X1 [Vespa crabro]XP_046815198.1 eukaryotic translation initiation factor 4E-binding protein Mextli isoform X1 [Vespa crabro]XP_046815199.1 eukaryotic translation initiation factor 4E-binding protein Mextli i
MATTQLNRARTIKKIEKPRPLKLNQRHTTVDGRITTVEDIVSLIDNVTMQLTNGFHDQTLQMNVITMCNHLKLYAHQLEAIYKDQLDRAFVAIRNGSQDERLDLTTRVHLLELIELRAKQWRHTDSMDVYYTHKLSHLDNTEGTLETIANPLASPLTVVPPTATSILGPGEVIKNSGKFAKPTRIPGKNYCKDEVVIRNSDSGKVMGIKGRRVHMIEELSQTIISFQRVNPGAKERLVQITGTSEDKIHYAKDLIKDTIQRNASPVRLEQGGGEKGGIGGSSSSLNSSASEESNRLQQHQQQNSRLRSSLLHSFSTNDASIGEYKYTVTVDNQSLKITGTNLDLVRTAKLVLDEYFLGDSEQFGSGIEYFTFDEKPALSDNNLSQTPLTPSNTVSLGRELSMDSAATSESEETYKSHLATELQSSDQGPEIRELTYEFLLLCSTGPYAKRPPADWARIQKECPNIVRKAPIRWFEPETYKAKVAAAGVIAILPAGEGETDPE